MDMNPMESRDIKQLIIDAELDRNNTIQCVKLYDHLRSHLEKCDDTMARDLIQWITSKANEGISSAQYVT